MKPVEELIKLSKALSILYVEDDAVIRDEMFEILEDFFKVVILAENGNDGLEKFEQFKKETGNYPDIIITDIHMPKSNGVEMSKKVLARNAEQLIIILSAHNESHYLLDLINMGIEHYLVKPVRSEHLLQTLHRASKKIHYRIMEAEYTKKLEKLAYEDHLTGIANRRHFFKKVNTLFLENRSNHFPIYLFIVDIDKFKEINDTFGHGVGDEVIRLFANIVKNELSPNDCFARIGGDEFVLVMHMSKEKVLYVMEKIQNKISETHALLGSNVDFTVSMGMTKIEDVDQDVETVVKRADINLYKEKRAKRKELYNQTLFVS